LPSSPLRALLGHLLPLDEAGELDDQPDEAEDDDDQRQDGEQQQPPIVPHDDQVFCLEPTIGSAGWQVNLAKVSFDAIIHCFGGLQQPCFIRLVTIFVNLLFLGLETGDY